MVENKNNFFSILGLLLGLIAPTIIIWDFFSNLSDGLFLLAIIPSILGLIFFFIQKKRHNNLVNIIGLILNALYLIFIISLIAYALLTF